MTLAVIIAIGILLSIIFHFIGVYVGAKRIVWAVIALMWAFAISFASGEIKPKGYEAINKMKGHDRQTDALIKEALPKISVYEMIVIKNSFLKHEKSAR